MKMLYAPYILVLAQVAKMLILGITIPEVLGLAIVASLAAIIYHKEKELTQTRLEALHNSLSEEVTKAVSDNKKILEDLKARVDSRSKEIDEVKQMLKMSKVGGIR